MRQKKISESQLVAARVFLDLFEALSDFASSAGLSTKQVVSIYRSASILNVARQQVQYSGKRNISGIAATTGIPRSEVSRTLRARGAFVCGPKNSQPTQKVMEGWRSDSRFTDKVGKPARLQLYGTGPTFEGLVKKHGKGLPTRAVLDELHRAKCLKFSGEQFVLLQSLGHATQETVDDCRALSAEFARALKMLLGAGETVVQVRLKRENYRRVGKSGLRG